MNKEKITIYSPDSSLSNPVLLIREMFVDLIASRELAWRLMLRDMRAQYRQTFLGFIWVLILPFANTIIWIFLSRSGIVNVSETSVPYPVYVFTGTMLWAILMESVIAPLHIVTASKSMLSKINFPREALILSGIYQTIFNAFIKIVLVIVALLIIGVFPGWNILFVPFAVMSLVLVGVLIGLMLTPIGMLYTDVGKSIPLLMQFLMYLTPVVFAMPKEGITAKMFQINPFSPLILTARDWLTGQTPEYLMYFVGVNVVAIIGLFFFWIVYRLAMPILIERIGG